MRQAVELFSESEASHRLVDRAIGELRPGAPAAQHAMLAGDVRSSMRDELFGLMAHLHFHDISARELDYAAERIAEMRHWMQCLEREGMDLPR